MFRLTRKSLACNKNKIPSIVKQFNKLKEDPYFKKILEDNEKEIDKLNREVEAGRVKLTRISSEELELCAKREEANRKHSIY